MGHFNNLQNLIVFVAFAFLQIRTLGMLRSRFEAVPLAFLKNLTPSHGEVFKNNSLVTISYSNINISLYLSV